MVVFHCIDCLQRKIEGTRSKEEWCFIDFRHKKWRHKKWKIAEQNDRLDVRGYGNENVSKSVTLIEFYYLQASVASGRA